MALKIESTSSSRSMDLVRIFLQNQRSGVVATADKAGNPHAAVVYYLFDDYCILFGTRRETQKFKNMEENRQAAFVVYDEATQTTAHITGRVEFIYDAKLKEKVINNTGGASIERSLENVPPSDKLTAGDYMIVQIRPMVIKLAEYAYARPGSENLFETILFSEED